MSGAVRGLSESSVPVGGWSWRGNPAGEVFHRDERLIYTLPPRLGCGNAVSYTHLFQRIHRRDGNEKESGRTDSQQKYCHPYQIFNYKYAMPLRHLYLPSFIPSSTDPRC